MAFELSNEMFINMKPSQIPKWKQGLSYYEQDIDTIVFWENEYRKINEGIVVNGYFVHPWLYFHLNFFKSPIPTAKGDVIMCPPLDDNFLYTIETYKEAEEQNKGICMFGCRGFAKSTMLASLAEWSVVRKPDGYANINGGSSNDLKAITDLVRTGIMNLEAPLMISTKEKDWKDGVYFSLVEKGTEFEYQYSSIRIKNNRQGQESASETGAGGNASCEIVDEIGKFDPRGLLESALPSWKNSFGMRLVPFLSGTGGSNKLSEGAKEILENPEAWSMLPMNWERLDKFTDPEYFDWSSEKKNKFCTFVPGQMSHRLESVSKVETNIGDFLGIKGEEISRIKIKITDWEKSTAEITRLKSTAKTEKQKNKHRMYYPISTLDCFLTDNENPFPIQKCIEKLNRIKADPQYKLGDFIPSSDESGLVFTFSDRSLAGREYKGTSVNAPWMVFGEIPLGHVPKNYFVAGLDDYKLDHSTTTSFGSLYILQRKATELGVNIETIRASLTERPDQHPMFHEKIERGLAKYNALCNLEGIDTGFKAFLTNTDRSLEMYLCKDLNPAQDLNSKKKQQGRNKFGTYPTPENKRLILNGVINYANRSVDVGIDSDGRKIIKFGVDFIEDPYLLEEMIAFEYGGNYDRITAFGHALLLAKEMDKNRVIPEIFDNEDDYKPTKRPAPKVKINNYGKRRFSNYSKLN